jgi:hypothetical protein
MSYSPEVTEATSQWMYTSYSHEVVEAAIQWMVHHRATEDPAVIAKIVERAQENLERLGGLISPSSFERAYLELISEKVIAPFRGSMTDKLAAPEIPPDVIAWIENPRVSSFEQRRRYATDPQFKKYYDLYADQQLKARIAQETGGVSLTAEEYRSLPAATAIQRYRRDRGFKIAVDKLIAQGKI